MLMNAVRALLAEPRPPQVPRRVWRDWWLTVLVAATAVLEGVFRNDVVWRPVAIVMAVLVAVSLLWRRTYPLAVVAAVFGSFIVLDVITLLSDVPMVGLNTAAFAVLLPYALLR